MTVTAILFDRTGRGFGRSVVLVEGHDAPEAVTWRGRVYVLKGQKLAGHTYYEVDVVQLATVRPAPGRDADV